MTSTVDSLVWVQAIIAITTLVTLVINGFFARQKAKDDHLRHQETVASLAEVQQKVEVVRTDVEVVRSDVDGKMKKLLEVTAEANNLRGQKEGRSEERAEQQLITPQVKPADAPSSKGEHDAVIAVTADAAALLKKKADVDEKKGKPK